MSYTSRTVTSTDNSVIKMISGLNDKKNRDKEGLFFVEGRFNLDEAVKGGLPIKYLLFTDKSLIKGLHNSGAELIHIDERIFNKITGLGSPGGIMAVVEKPQIRTEDLVLGKVPLIIIGDNIRDPGNAGTMIRSADAAGADAVIFSEGSADIYNPKTVRSTGGSLFHLPVVNGCGLAPFLRTLKEQKSIRLIAADAKAKTLYTKVDFNLPSAIIIGNEASGISKEIKALCDVTAAIPIIGKAESLNAAVSCSILLYEAVRQRCIKK
ncbi:MAG: RNA methyltransferase [Candidatus Margulisiibacteriota bacterium]